MALAEESIPEAHSENVGATIEDTGITAEMKAKLMRKYGVRYSDIDVTITNGVVTLEGSTTRNKAKSLAESATKSVAGVKSVDRSGLSIASK